MSPYIRSMLEDAADDNGRPVTTDLDRIRSVGRRTVWRRRGLVGAGGLGVVAVITSVALLAPGGPVAGFQPAGDGVAGPAPTVAWAPEDALDDPIDDAIDDAIEPLVEALEANGYDVAEAYSTTVTGTSDPSDGSVVQMTAKVLPVARGDSVGAAVGAAFNDVSAVTDIFLGEVEGGPLPSEVDGYDSTEQCAVFPAFVHRSNFAWENCDPTIDPPPGASVMKIATGGDSHGDALGVTIVRPDGSGVSLAVSTATYDRPVESGGEPVKPLLEELPLSADELILAAERMLEVGPVFPPPEEQVVAGPTAGVETAAPPPGLPPSTEPDTWRPSQPGTETCPDGSTIVEAEDELGTTRFVQVEGTTWVCASAGRSDDSAQHYVGPWRNQAAAPLTGEWIGPFALDTCGSRPCGPALWSAIGVAPVGVTQVSVVVSGGTTVSAKLADRSWLLRIERPTSDELPGTRSAEVDGDTLIVTVEFDPVTWPTVEPGSP